MTVYFTAHDDRYLDRYRDFCESIRLDFGIRARVLVSTSARRSASDEVVQHLHDGEWERRLRAPIDVLDTSERLRQFAPDLPSSVFRSDLRLDLGWRTADQLGLESAVLAERISAEFDRDPPRMVFTSSGTNIVHSIAQALASTRGASVYRVHQYLNLNPGMRGARVWFCTNNRMALSGPAERFGHPESNVAEHVRALNDATLSRANRLDEISKSFRSRRMPTSLPALLRDVARVALAPVRRDPLRRQAAGPSKDRLRVLRNSARVRRLVTPTAQLPASFVLFALNTPYDSQILVRAPQYRDLLSLIELVAGLLPFGTHLVLREHPAFVGSLDYARLASLLERHPQVVLGSSEDPLPEVMTRSRGVLIINNTAFVDAVLLEKPVIALGDGYFKGRRVVHEVEYLRDLQDVFARLEAGALSVTRREHLESLMAELFQETWPEPGVVDHDKVGVILEGARRKIKRAMGSGDQLAVTR